MNEPKICTPVISGIVRFSRERVVGRNETSAKSTARCRYRAWFLYLLYFTHVEIGARDTRRPKQVRFSSVDGGTLLSFDFPPLSPTKLSIDLVCTMSFRVSSPIFTEVDVKIPFVFFLARYFFF